MCTTRRSMPVPQPRSLLLLHRVAIVAVAVAFAACSAPALAAEPTMAPMPGMPMATPAPASSPPAARGGGMDMSSMRYNANGVLSMYGMTKSGMHMDMSASDPATMPSTTAAGT